MEEEEWSTTRAAAGADKEKRRGHRARADRPPTDEARAIGRRGEEKRRREKEDSATGTAADVDKEEDSKRELTDQSDEARADQLYIEKREKHATKREESDVYKIPITLAGV